MAGVARTLTRANRDFGAEPQERLAQRPRKMTFPKNGAANS